MHLASSGKVGFSVMSASNTISGELLVGASIISFSLCNTMLGLPLRIWRFFLMGSSLPGEDELHKEDDVEDEDEDDWAIHLLLEIFLGAGLFLPDWVRPAFARSPWNSVIW